jgi:uncharacterized protein (TIGR02284 family)
MSREQELLQQIVRIATSGRNFFADMKTRIADPEVHTAFEYISDVKDRFVRDLSQWVPAGKAEFHDNATATNIERFYASLKRTFDGARPQRSAAVLDVSEQQLMCLVERAFEVVQSPVLRSLLKAHYPALVVCREAMARLHTRKAA